MKKKVFLSHEITKRDFGKFFERDYSQSLKNHMSYDSNGILHTQGKYVELAHFEKKTTIPVQAWDLGCGNIVSSTNKVIECAEYLDVNNNIYYVAYTHLEQSINEELYSALYLFQVDLNCDVNKYIFDNPNENIFEHIVSLKITNSGVNFHIEFDDTGCLLWNQTSNNRNDADVVKYCYQLVSQDICKLDDNASYLSRIDKLIYDNSETSNVHFHKVDNNNELYVVVIEPKKKNSRANYSAIVVCLGGPNIDIPDFKEDDSIYNRFSNNEFYVIIPLRRGVRGISYQWENCINGNCGGAEIVDTIDSVKFVLNMYKEIDKCRVTLYGGSYGGYVSLLIAGKSNSDKIFNKIISHCGVYDLSTYPDECLGNRMDVMIGYTNCCSEEEYNDKIKTISPNNYINNWNVPVLLIHSIDDTTVWFGQSVKAYNQALAANKQVLMWLTTGGHTINNNIEALFNEIIKFIIQ